MELLREPQIVAIDDFIVALRGEADRLEAAVEEADAAPDVDDALAQDLRKQIDGFRSTAEQLAGIVRGLGDVPHGPSEEVVIVEKAALKLKSMLSTDTATTLADDASQAAQRISTAASAALPDITDSAAQDIVQGLI